MLRHAFSLLLLVALALPSAGRAATPAAPPLAHAEKAFLDHLDAVGAVGYLESGAATRFEEQDVATWRRKRDASAEALKRDLASVREDTLDGTDRAALAAMHRTLEAQAADGTTDGSREYGCSDAQDRKLDYGALRSALVACFIQHGNALRLGDRTIDRGTALQLLHVVDDANERKAIFDAFVPLWTALNGRNEPDSPYRRLLRLAADDARRHGSEVEHAAQALGLSVSELEQWLVRLLEAWRDANPATLVEPWDFRYVNGLANRQLQSRIPAETLLPANRLFYADLGANLDELRVVFDLAPRADKSPLAYTDFLRRGRETDKGWRRAQARVLGTYPAGGLFSLNELVHENGHAVHVSAIHTRPAYMDWPDTLFVEAFADVPSWSVYEPAWQRKYLGAEVAEDVSMRALYANVMLDVAWSLFELRLLRDPGADPNAVWTDITREYLHVRPHPEVPWWAMRVQLAGNPGYMVNYGLGAVLTADMRERTAAAIGTFDTGNPRWYDWLSSQLLRYGSERDTRALMHGLLGRGPTPDALLRQIRRCSAPPR